MVCTVCECATLHPPSPRAANETSRQDWVGSPRLAANGTRADVQYMLLYVDGSVRAAAGRAVGQQATASCLRRRAAAALSQVAAARGRWRRGVCSLATATPDRNGARRRQCRIAVTFFSSGRDHVFVGGRWP